MPLRVLQLTSTSKIGGAETMVLHLLRHADPARLQVEVLSLMGPGDLTARAREAGAWADNWGLVSLANPRLPARMRALLIERNYDVIHGYGLRADLITRWVALGLKIPYISSISSIDPWRKKQHVLLDRWTAEGVACWIAVCEAARQSRITRERFPAQRIFTVLNGIPDLAPPTADETRAARERFGITAEAGPVLSMVANLREAKGYPDLLAALEIVKREFPNFVCLCAGSDESHGAIPALAARHGVEANVRWLGFVTDPQSVLAAGDIAVLSSHWEGCPVNLIEAMRAARPSVATHVGGIPELIDSGAEGLLVPVKNPPELASALLRLMREPALRQRLGTQARTRYERQFRVERMVDQLTALYTRFARGHN
jgi:glycosyltransferase involved in cell wall biosynthesis